MGFSPTPRMAVSFNRVRSIVQIGIEFDGPGAVSLRLGRVPLARVRLGAMVKDFGVVAVEPDRRCEIIDCSGEVFQSRLREPAIIVQTVQVGSRPG